MKEILSTSVPVAANETQVPFGDDNQKESGARAYRHGLELLIKAAIALPNVARGLSATWPTAVREIVPGAAVGIAMERTWMPVLAYLLFHALPGTAEPQAVFDSLDMRAALAEAFSEVGISGEDSWRFAAKVRLLLGGRTPLDALRTEGFWANGDVRWLCGVNESEGVNYLNKESFEQLLCWLQIPGLLGIAGHLDGDDAYEAPKAELAEIEGTLRAECERMEEAGYKLKAYLGEETEEEPQAVEDEAIVP
jgi:hypothetical protein